MESKREQLSADDKESVIKNDENEVKRDFPSIVRRKGDRNQREAEEEEGEEKE